MISIIFHAIHYNMYNLLCLNININTEKSDDLIEMDHGTMSLNAEILGLLIESPNFDPYSHDKNLNEKTEGDREPPYYYIN